MIIIVIIIHPSWRLSRKPASKRLSSAGVYLTLRMREPLTWGSPKKAALCFCGFL